MTISMAVKVKFWDNVSKERSITDHRKKLNLWIVYLYYAKEHNFIIIIIIIVIITTNVIRYSPIGPCLTVYSEVTIKEIVSWAEGGRKLLDARKG
jgi:CRISPR/Cas system-associated exonuclease Cas4 (RecB family)